MGSQLIDITTTAVLRPEILEITLSSFRERLFKDHPVRLILHVDKVGSDTVTVEDMHAIARSYFSDVVLLTKDDPDQNQALKACWDRVETEFFFNLEDDYKLVVDLDLLDMLDIMRSKPKMASLRLPWNRSTDKICKIYKVCKWTDYYQWNGRYYERPATAIPTRFGGLPSLLRTEWMRSILPHIQPGVAIESLCVKFALSGNPLSTAWEWGAYTRPNTRTTIIDLGTKWRKQHGFHRDNPRRPTKWVKV